MPHETLSAIKPREYQKQIYETCKDNNCLVILPTGIGKTLIALMLAINRQKRFPGSKIVFLAPTRPLAEQHLEYFKKYLPELFADLQLFTGKINAKKRREIWQTADIIFSTPQCIGNDLKKCLYSMEEVSLLIEDECVTGDTVISLSDGRKISIRELYNKFDYSKAIFIESLNKFGDIEPRKILKAHKIKNKKKIVKLKTKAKEIKLTEDHKLIIKRGSNYLWTKAKNIKNGDYVAVYPNIKNLEYKDRTITSEEKLIKNSHLNKKILDLSFSRTINKLNEKGMLPLKYSNPKLKIISRLFGFVLGDGWFTKIKGAPKILGFSGKIEDLEKIQRDLEILGFRYPKILSRRTNSFIRTDQNKVLEVNGTTNSFNVTDSALAKLFEVLKLPQGNKTSNPFLIPEWLMKSPKFIKKEFLAALMGCEGDIPKFIKNLRSPYAIRYRFNKLNSLQENSLEYANQIKKLFKEFGIQSTIQIKRGNIIKDKQRTIQIQITISNSNFNIYRFLKEIGYEYNYKKIKEANKILNYLDYKEDELKKRNFFYEEIIKLKNKGFKTYSAIQIISKKFKIKPTKLWSLGYSNKANHASWLIDSYDKWSKGNKPHLNVNWEKIENIKKEKHIKYVYDLTVEKNHNYIGNAFIIHNCHRCLKNYSYTYVVEKYKEQAKNRRVLGLTASPGADRATIEKIAKNLDIEKIEIRTRDSNDVKEYIQKAEIEIIKIDFPPEFDKIRVNLKKIFDKKTNELRNRRLLFGPPTKKFLLETQGRIMKSISSGNRHFNLLSGASACSQAIKLQHALELLETQTLSSFNEYMQDLFQQAKEQKSKAVQNLVKQPVFNQAYVGLIELLARKVEHPKLEILRNILKNSIEENKKLKVIVFTQYRTTAAKIAKEVKEIPGIIPKIFIGQAIKENKSGEKQGLSQKEQKEVINDFKEGRINVLVATSIGEEGLDIPEVNAVIFYEPVPSAIRKIQRAGRTARLMEGKIITLVTLGTRDEAYYYAAIGKEKKMYSAVNALKNEFDSLKEDKTENKNVQKSLIEG